MNIGIGFNIVFAILTLWAYSRGHRSGLLVLWVLMLGIGLGNTSLGQTAYGAVTGILAAAGQALISAFNGAVG